MGEFSTGIHSAGARTSTVVTDEIWRKLEDEVVEDKGEVLVPMQLTFGGGLLGRHWKMIVVC